MQASPLAKDEAAARTTIVLSLTEQALNEFETAARLDEISEYPHVAIAQWCIRVIEWGRALSHANTYADFFTQPANARFADLISTAEDALEKVQEIIGGDSPSRYVAEVRAQILGLYDDYSGMLQGWQNLLGRTDVIKAPIRRRIVRAYCGRAGGWRAMRQDDRRKALTLLEENLGDDPRDGRSTLEWLRGARFSNVSLDRAAELVSYWVEAEGTRDAFFYEYVLSTLLALGGRDSAIADYPRKLDRSRERAALFPHRRFLYEWLGHGEGLGQLVNYQDLRNWERRSGGADPGLLTRIPGRVERISRPQSGMITFGPGLSAFFTPAVAGMVDKDVNSRVSMLLGFSYEGPQAWSVRREP